jgi:hypothetical protein
LRPVTIADQTGKICESPRNWHILTRRGSRWRHLSRTVISVRSWRPRDAQDKSLHAG